MLRTAGSMARCIVRTVLLLVLASSPALLADGGRVTVDTEESSCKVERDTRLNRLDDVVHQLFLPDQNTDVKLTSMIQLFPLDPALFDADPVRRAKAKLTIGCSSPSGSTTIGSTSKKLDKTGHLAISEEIPAAANCEFFFLQWQFQKKFELPAGTSPIVRSSVETVDPAASADCFRTDRLCLNDDRFRVQVNWRDFDNIRGPGIAFPRSDDSGTFFFFDPDNTELLLKVLDGCRSNDRFWVFYAATTNVEFTITVTDTQSNQTRDYFNPLGRPSPAIIDTQAFATCP